MLPVTAALTPRVVACPSLAVVLVLPVVAMRCCPRQLRSRRSGPVATNGDRDLTGVVRLVGLGHRVVPVGGRADDVVALLVPRVPFDRHVRGLPGRQRRCVDSTEDDRPVPLDLGLGGGAVMSPALMTVAEISTRLPSRGRLSFVARLLIRRSGRMAATVHDPVPAATSAAEAGPPRVAGAVRPVAPAEGGGTGPVSGRFDSDSGRRIRVRRVRDTVRSTRRCRPATTPVRPT